MSDVWVEGRAWAEPVSVPQPESIARGGSLSARVVEGFEAYRGLEADWLRLAALQTGTVVFQAPDLLQFWADHFAAEAGQRFITVVVRDSSNRAVLIWPVLVERVGLVRVARGAGAPVGQYDEVLLDPGCDPAATWKAATDALTATVRPDLICLERVRGDGALAAALGNAAPIGTGEAAPYSDLSRGVAEFMATLKPRIPRQHKKRVRRFEQEGKIGFEVAAGPEQTAEWLAEAIEMKRLWLHDTGRFSRAFMKPETLRCLDACARALGRVEASPRMVVSRLTLDGRTAAMETAFVQGGAYHLYMGTFAADLAKFGPGNVLTEKVLHWCAANEIHRYDMLSPRSRHKAEWQSGEVVVRDYALPTTMLGRAYVWTALRHAVPAMRKVFYSMPAPVRTALTGFALRKLPKVRDPA